MSKWSLYPTEIEVDLLPGIDIHDWHRGTLDGFGAFKLSSRRLLALLAGLKETSNYKKSRRGGYLSEGELVLRETYNEISHLRASYYAINGGEDSAYEPFEFIDPVVRVEKILEETQRNEEAEQASERFYGEMGWS